MNLLIYIESIAGRMKSIPSVALVITAAVCRSLTRSGTLVVVN